MYLSNNENSFNVIKIDVYGEQTNNIVSEFAIDKKYNDVEVQSKISICDFIQDNALVLESFSIDAEVKDGRAYTTIPFSILNALQASTYSIQVTLSYNGTVIKNQAIIIKKEGN